MISRQLYLEKLINRKNNGAIKVITGLRRSGKSTLLFNLYYNYLINLGIKSENIIKIDLDSDEFENLHEYKLLGSYIRSKINDSEQFYIFIDEVQFCPNFEKVLNSLNRQDNLDLYVTGSNSKFLSSDILTEFRGRGDEIRVQPLSFKEYYDSLVGIDFGTALNNYLTYGGLPRLLSLNTEEQKIEYLTKLFNETYLKDIIDRNNLRGEEILEKLVNVLASSIGSLTSPNKLSKTASSAYGSSFSDKTIKVYIDYLKDSFLINEAQRYDVKGKQYFQTLSKYYFTDLGLRNARLNFRQFEPSHLMENLIYNELLYRGYNVDVGIIEINDKNTKKKIEIDFVCNFGSKRYYIQSAYSLPTEEKMNQELRPLLNTNDFFKKIIIVREDINSYFNEKGVYIISLKSFLLDFNSLEK